MTVSASAPDDSGQFRKPFAIFDMLNKPEGSIRFNGVHVDYFTDRSGFYWQRGEWEFFIWGKNTNNAVNLMKRMMDAFPEGVNPVPGAAKGQITAYDRVIGINTDTAWTNPDQRAGYVISSRGTPEQMVKVLRSIVNANQAAVTP